MKFPEPLSGENLDSFLKIISALTKVGILIGGICVALYSMRIGHFPQDLTIGDGVLLIFIAASFGFIYLFYIYSLISLGIACSPVILPIFNSAMKAVNRHRTRPIAPQFEWVKFNFGSVLCALLAIVLIVALGRKDAFAYWSLPLLSLILYMLYSAFLSAGKKLKSIDEIHRSQVHTDQKDNVGALGDPSHIRRTQMGILAFILFAPLFYGGVSGQLLEIGMSMANIRKDHATVYVKSPYAFLLPEQNVSDLSPKLPDYKRFDNVSVLFHGLGKRTVVSFDAGGRRKNLTVPDDYIILN